MCASSTLQEFRHHAWQHSQVRRFEIACDEGEPDARSQLCECREHMHMGVPAADEHDVSVHRHKGIGYPVRSL